MKNRKNFILFLCIVGFIAVVYNYYNVYNNDKAKNKLISYSNLFKKTDSGDINKVVINGNLVKAYSKEGITYNSVILVNDQEFINLLKNKDVEIVIAPPQSSGGAFSFLFIIIAIIFIYLIIRSLRNSGDSNSPGSGGGGPMGAFSFGKSKAKFISPKDINVTFADVAGIEEAKHEVMEIVDFLKNPVKFQKLGAKIPKGCLLYGPPGSGKTLLAKAIAGEAKVAYFSISGSDFVEMFVGVGASRVRDLFNQAKKQAPCIVFIDEIDAVGRQRGVGVGGGNDEREQTLNQLLVEMDGFTTNQGVIVIAASNRKDVLDAALLRPGRFDRQVFVPLPDLIGREKILSIYLAKVPLDTTVDVNVLARGTTGFSGADLANLVNEAALIAATASAEKVGMNHFEMARDKILMGTERKSSKMNEKDRKLTAYHEAGHALVAFKVADFYPVHKVTIIPRGMSLGVTSFLPEEDEYNRSYVQLTSQLAVLFGGRLSEELIFGKENITTGASMDIKMATNIAKRMIVEWGFSDKIGRLRYSEQDNSGFSAYKPMSEDTAKEIEEEMKKLINTAEETARKILIDYKEAHANLALALLEFETLTGAEAKMLCLEGVGIKEIREKKLLGNTMVADKIKPSSSSLPSIE